MKDAYTATFIQLYSPTHILPMMRQPAMEAWTTGTVSDSSPSNTLNTQHQVTSNRQGNVNKNQVKHWYQWSRSAAVRLPLRWTFISAFCRCCGSVGATSSAVPPHWKEPGEALYREEAWGRTQGTPRCLPKWWWVEIIKFIIITQLRPDHLDWLR